MTPTSAHTCTLLRQERIDHGVLIRWTKGFGAPGAEGKDCAAMFKQGLEKFVRVFSSESRP